MKLVMRIEDGGEVRVPEQAEYIYGRKEVKRAI